MKKEIFFNHTNEFTTPPLNDASRKSSAKIRLHFIDGLYTKQNWIDLENVDTDALKKFMQEPPEEECQVSFHSANDRYYSFNRKHLSHFDII